MSDAAYRLPLFPLPLVLFPGAAVPLHVFELRYRRLLADVQAGNGRFGIVLAGAAAPAAGLVGCVAHVRDVQPLPDGRSTLVVDGGARFAVVRLVDADQPYAVADVAPYADLPDADVLGDELPAGADRVRTLFARVARAAAALADDDAPPPALPADPAEVAFAAAALVDFDAADRQRVLASRSPAERLALVEGLLARGVDGLEERARVHASARGNGHGPHA